MVSIENFSTTHLFSVAHHKRRPYERDGITLRHPQERTIQNPDRFLKSFDFNDFRET